MKSLLHKPKAGAEYGAGLSICGNLDAERITLSNKPPWLTGHKALRAQLQVMPRQADTILVGERGKPLKPDSLTLNVSRMLRAMGVTGYSIHGLRKNASRALAEAGCGDREIMAITENGAKVALHRAR
jgi:hypothetical protein